MLVPFLWATGVNEQLRFRILPLEHFSNVKVLYTRRDAGMPTDNLIVHAGSLHGAEKVSRHGRRGKRFCGLFWALLGWISSCGWHSKRLSAPLSYRVTI